MKNTKLIIGIVVGVVAVAAIVLAIALGGGAHVHVFGEWETVRAATCTVEGSKERYCDCGEKQMQSIAVTGHEYGEWETVKAATCTVEGSKERCCDCGESQTATIALKEHEFGQWRVSKAATFSEEGEETRNCSCGKIETRSIPKKVEPITTSLTKAEYIAELEEIFENMTEKSTLRFNDHDNVYARYFDGAESFVYSYGGKEEDGWDEIHAGKVGNEYLMFTKHIESSSVAKSYEKISADVISYFIEYMNEVLFEDVWDSASLEYDSDDGFECEKTVSDQTVYRINGVNGISTSDVIVTVIDGLISEIATIHVTTYNGQSYTDEYKTTFDYTSEILMPDKAEYAA